MSKYIKETVVKDYVWDLLNDCGHGGLTPQDINEQVTRCVEYMLLEDCVEIARCKDCKYKVVTDDGEYNPQDIVCSYWASDGLEEDDFCSYGELKESEE